MCGVSVRIGDDDDGCLRYCTVTLTCTVLNDEIKCAKDREMWE